MGLHTVTKSSAFLSWVVARLSPLRTPWHHLFLPNQLHSVFCHFQEPYSDCLWETQLSVLGPYLMGHSLAHQDILSQE